MTNIKTVIHQYQFYINKAADKEAYEALKTKLAAMGLKCFESHGSGSHYNGDLDGRELELETKHIFNNQWNTAPIDDAKSGLRVFDWAQDYQVYNKNLKQGHWLEQTPDLVEVRRNRKACGYCGHQEEAQKGTVFCPHCIDSEYLEAKELHLTRMVYVMNKGDRKPLTDAEKAHLLPLYKEAQLQLHGTTARRKARLVQQRSDIEAKFKSATHNTKAEHDGFIWLLDHGVKIDNVIYYSHTGKFSFGWHLPISDEIKSELLDLISEFPFAYEIKCVTGAKLEAA